MRMTNEWTDRIGHWLHTLEKDMYLPLAEIPLSVFVTRERLTLAELTDKPFAPISPGTAWGRHWDYGWLKGEIVLPQAAQDKLIILKLAPGGSGEGTLFVNGQAFGTCRNSYILVPHHYWLDNMLCQKGQPGARYEILCEAFAGHHRPRGSFDQWAAGPVRPGDYPAPDDGGLTAPLGECTFGVWNEDAYQLWLDVIALRDVMQTQTDGSLRAAQIAAALKRFTRDVVFDQPQEERNASYRLARKNIKPLLEKQNGNTAPTLYAVGHAHLDLAWLWTFAETRRKTARTFGAQLRLLEKYPDYKFFHSQPQSYEMCREDYPELFARVLDTIKQGRWIADGSMWVEPDANMTGGESLIRQCLYGLRYFKDVLGVDCKLLWLPDSFGYSAVLPQIMRGFHLRYMVTQKIFCNYNGGEKFPYNYFTWEGNDGSTVTAFLPTNYTYNTNPAELNEIWETREQKDDRDGFLVPFGYGDGGGGPCRDFIEFCQRAKDLEGCPKVVMENPAVMFEALEKAGPPKETYTGELYYQGHRGVFTTQAGIKKGNRKAEFALREAELWGTLAQFHGYVWDAVKMEQAWKKTLLNQFHDILPGSSIAEVFDEAAVLHKEAIETAAEVAASAAARLAGTGTQIAVCNSLSWPRTVTLSLPEQYKSGAEDGEGNVVPVARHGETLLATVSVPACGMTSLSPAGHNATPAQTATAYKDGENFVLENDQVKAVFSAQGELHSFVLKARGRELAGGPMNRFHLYEDTPRRFDAWSIDSHYTEAMLETGHDATVALGESGPLLASLVIIKSIGKSTIKQTVKLYAQSRRVEFHTEVDWRELHRLLKVAFPVAVHAQEAVNEIQFGYVTHATTRSTAYDKDRFEVCNHRYTAMFDQNHGAAVLNDCKYGVSQLGNTIALSLLRAAAVPAMRTDNGIHHFTYAFTGWDGSFFDCDVVRQGYELNVEPLTVSGEHKNISYFTVDAPNVILETVKPAQDQSGDIILRLYESKKADTRTAIHVNIPLKSAYVCDMAEEICENLEVCPNGTIYLSFRTFEIKTIRLVPIS